MHLTINQSERKLPCPRLNVVWVVSSVLQASVPQKLEMFTNTASTRLLSAGVLDQEQLEDSERLRRLGETQRRTASALLVPASVRSQSAPDPVTKSFLGTSLFSKLLSRQASSDTVAERRLSEASLVSRISGQNLRKLSNA